MALRRPPTRIELKADDVEEYDKVRRSQERATAPRPPISLADVVTSLLRSCSYLRSCLPHNGIVFRAARR